MTVDYNLSEAKKRMPQTVRFEITPNAQLPDLASIRLNRKPL
jgi:hypothetical protein